MPTENINKSVKDMTLEEKIQLCFTHGYDIDGDVHNGEYFYVISPNASIEERRKIYQMSVSN